jgi:dTDP-4-dehydrorhamnose reductase
MRALVIGAGGKIGSALVKALELAGHEPVGVTRKFLDLTALPSSIEDAIGPADVVYICAASTRFIDCESDPDAYRVNVDAPIEIAKQYMAQIVYISSEAVERALHTNYGMHKALAEIGLRAVCNPVIARLGKVDSWSMQDACEFLVSLSNARPGVYRWNAQDPE